MTNERSPDCTHDFDGHLVIATTGDPMDGGIIICQVKGCMFFSTWAPGWHNSDGTDTKLDAKRVPDLFELAELRHQLQTEEPDGIG